MIELVQEFHKKFGLPDGSQDILSSNKELQMFRLNFLKEEMTELTEGLFTEDRVEAFDALLDLTYVAFGSALALGISPEQWNAGMAAVHSANMKKIRVQRAEESKRGSTFDVRKPEGWVAPQEELRKILGEK
jgi:predicted HAD superfamily Cof-like phosphohydrolase